MVSWTDHDQMVAKERIADDPQLGLGAPADRQIGTLTTKTRYGFTSIRDLERYLYIRTSLPERTDQRRQDALPCGCNCDEAQVTGPPRRLFHGTSGAVGEAQDLLGVSGQLDARRCEADAPSHTLYQFDPQLTLERG